MESVFRPELLIGKTALVTGGGSGINLAIAQRLASQGARVALMGRTVEKLNTACREIEEAGGIAMGVAADVRDYSALEAGARTVRDAWGEMDILVCGAAGNFPAPAATLSANGFRAVVDIDLNGTFNACRASFEHLRKPGASVIAISATQASHPTPFQAHVCAAKAGVDMLTRCLALEWGPVGIRVNAIAPGPVEDTEGMRRLTPSEEIKEKVAAVIPLRRYARKEEIADLALFLVTPASAYLTGAVLVCDGGQSLSGSGGYMAAMGW